MSDRKPPDDAVAEFLRDSDGMPNQRAALPPGTLPGPFFGPQGDENRDPARLPTLPPIGADATPRERKTPNRSPKRSWCHMSSATTTTDHDFIRTWIEGRGGRPSRVKGTEGGDGEGILRVDFAEPDDTLEPVSWDEFFRTFEDRGLAFLHQDKQGSKTSRFFKFVRRQ